MNYILLTFLVTVRCSAYISLDRSSLHRQDYLHSRQDSPSSPLDLSDYFVPVVAISFFTSLFTSIGKFDLPAFIGTSCDFSFQLEMLHLKLSSFRWFLTRRRRRKMIGAGEAAIIIPLLSSPDIL